jgi:hypothetical protein
MKPDDITTFRRMIAEPTTTTYSDLALAEYIKHYPVEDIQGEAPFIESTEQITEPETYERNPDWIPTYDLNAAAADIWAEKASGHAACFDFSADGGSYSRSQVYEMCMKQSRYYRARRSIGTITLRPEPLAHGLEETLLDDEESE